MLANLAGAAALAQALAATTAITMDHSRVEALTGLAPQMPADLLAQALGSAPRTAPQALMALPERGQALQRGGGYQAMCTCSDGCISMVAMRAADHHSAAQPRDDLVLNCADKRPRNNLGLI